MALTSITLVLVTMVTLACGQDHQMQQGTTGGVQQHGKLHDKQNIQDPAHIKEHLDGRIDVTENMSEDELNFYYFKVHDYDNNSRLDGIELISALTHHHGNNEATPDEPRMPDQELTNMIDLIMTEDDTNNDGYVDYAEFIMSQRR